MTGSILITGGTGYLGGHLVAAATAVGWHTTATHHTSTPAAGPPLGPPLGAAVRWERLDVTDRAAVVALLARVRPDVVVHTASGAWRSGARAGLDRDWAVTADGAANVAVAAAAAGARLVHVSTDAVLAGTAAPYDESARPDPVNRYGAAKAAAETAVRAADPAAAVARAPLIVGDGASRHERLVHALHDGTATGALFTDRHRTPVHVGDLAAALLELAGTDHAGVLNVAGPDAVSWYELGLLVARRDGLDPARLPAGRAADHGIVMPADTRLSTDLARTLLRTRLRGAREFLAAGAAGAADRGQGASTVAVSGRSVADGPAVSR
jgi:dTDP-4-dehydrorhamnose reductase